MATKKQTPEPQQEGFHYGNFIRRMFKQSPVLCSRLEYWAYQAIFLSEIILVGMIVNVAPMFQEPPLMWLIALVPIVHSAITVVATIGRLHDIGLSGWMVLVSAVPIIGGFVFLYFMCQRSDAFVAEGKVNKYRKAQKQHGKR